MRPTSRPGPTHARRRRLAGVGLGVACAVLLAGRADGRQGPALAGSSSSGIGPSTPASITRAQHLFYDGLYDAAAAEALTLRTTDPGNLSAYEVRSSSLHFQIRQLLGSPRDKGAALKRCAACPALLSLFADETASGQKAARARVQQNPADAEALFFLGKLDLNYVWLQLDTLGRRTGWSEFREARRSIDTALEDRPGLVRAQVARGWIDYIVDTRVPLGLRWLLGGGDKQRGLLAVRQAAATATDFYVRTEATFGLWDMQVREKDLGEAVTTARTLAHDFPDNAEIAKFLNEHQ